ncbi:MAG: hypothetical protein PHX51_07235 [Clostridia bacterium]|nr:hypothetical protein [Clostridia bacterium]
MNADEFIELIELISTFTINPDKTKEMCFLKLTNIVLEVKLEVTKRIMTENLEIALNEFRIPGENETETKISQGILTPLAEKMPEFVNEFFVPAENDKLLKAVKQILDR